VKLINFLSTIFWFPISSKNKVEKYQERIRKLEWDAIKHYIPKQANFLDVGCGAGYNLIKAYTELGCIVQGIDPAPGAHGVGRFTQDLWKDRPIIEGSAEMLPFQDGSFDVVYSSHVLEHVNSEQKALDEMKRVLKPGGVLIIGMPTAAMTMVGMITTWFFTTHINIYLFILSIGQKTAFNNFIRILVPTSHSFPRAKYIGYDLKHYSISNWKKIVAKSYVVEKVITPGLYPYPDYIQWFPLLRIGKLSSSVFFICKN
jgi:ubiquinone/menaquinone biosynthesis C-methylase UbiE